MRSATPREHEDVAALLARAFADEPFWRWTTGGSQERRLAFAHLTVALAAGHGTVLVAPAMTCTALVLEPGVLPQPPHRALPQLPGLARATGARHLPQVLRGLLRVEHLHPPGPHLTLLALGVDPEHRGLGLGGAALHAVAARADARGLPVHLETSTERARALYLRHGFAVTAELELASGGPPVWAMLRPPGA